MISYHIPIFSIKWQSFSNSPTLLLFPLFTYYICSHYTSFIFIYFLSFQHILLYSSPLLRLLFVSRRVLIFNFIFTGISVASGRGHSGTINAVKISPDEKVCLYIFLIIMLIIMMIIEE